jgi:hypothetical protein
VSQAGAKPSFSAATSARVEDDIDRREEVASLGAFALVAPQARKAGRSPQLQRFRLLAPRGIDRPLQPQCRFGSVAGLGQNNSSQPV